MPEGTEFEFDEAAGRIIALGALSMGVLISAEAEELLLAHARLVYEANRTLNLTRIAAGDAVGLHILDSLSGIHAMLEAPEGPWVDIGSGAGYPGVPLAVASGRHVDLVESTGKKARFLERVSEDLRLDVTVRDCRAEEAGQANPAGYSAVSARAVALLPALVELASPLLVPGGLLVCWKGAVTAEELDRGRRAADECGMSPVGPRTVKVPGTATVRTLVVYAKSGRPRATLPRRPGMAQRRPLA